MAEPTLYWHDYETFGIDPRRDRPAQFAGIRTDYDLNIIDDALVVYCKLQDDYLPNPEACLLTGITPQLVEEKGVVEAEFIRRIHDQIIQPNTCVLGYNSIRFDDEFTRNNLYRNFYDPYAREWQQGNSRWDLIDVVRATRALRPDGINWPVDEDGRPSFKLEELTKANGIEHQDAHDALADVYATIALAKLIKSAQPKLYDYLWRHKTKAEATKLLQLHSFTPLVHVSGRFPTAKNCLAVVLPVCAHPTNQNGVLVYDLAIDPEPLLTLSAEEIRQRVFTAVAELPEGVERVPLKTVHINKCPVLAPIKVLREIDLARLNIDLSICYHHLEQIKQDRQLAEKLSTVFSPEQAGETEQDPDLMLYSGGFFPDRDRRKMSSIITLNAEQLSQCSLDFIDKRLNQMLFRYRARNFPDSLASVEKIQWREFCLNKLNGNENVADLLTFSRFSDVINRLKQEPNANNAILEQLTEYAEMKKHKLGE